MVKFDADLLEVFAGAFLSPRYDEAKPTPEFHRQAWRMYCSDHPQVAIAAPRNHAKSTSLTHDYILGMTLFRQEQYVMILGSSEEMAIEHLQDISHELHQNDHLIREFSISKFVTDQKTDIVIQHRDGYQFRIIARGGEQKIRGRKWNGKRPGLIVCDDIEDDEQVESKERREKFGKWFFRAAKQALRDGGKIRMHGTILHDASLLSRLMKNKQWLSKKYSAHAGFDDFSDILWPEKFSEQRLRSIRQEFIDEGDSAGYSQEYLNDPLDNDDQYFRRDDFLPMAGDDHDSDKVYVAGGDLAASKADRGDPSALVVAGKDTLNTLHYCDVRKGRWDMFEIIEEMFSLQQRWNLEAFFLEGGAIATAILPMIYAEMRRRDIYINIVKVPPMKDKASRARSLQRRMRAGGVKFDQQAEWYPGFEAEMRRFTGHSRAAHDDQVDAAAYVSYGFDSLHEVEPEDFLTDDENEFIRHQQRSRGDGRSTVTGY